MQAVSDRIDDDFEATVAELLRLCRQPSISAQGVGLQPMAELLAETMAAHGLSVRLLPVAGGPPAVYGELAGDSAATLLFYNHYDVQPPEPLELWTSPPFDPEVRDGKLYGRGVSDNKGDLAARLAAIAAVRAIRGRLPVSVKFIVEGEEEVGSPHLEPFIEAHRDLLAADACLWEGGEVNWQGQPTVVLGAKGICYVELEVRTANRDVHSSLATLVPNAAWRLVWALASLKDADERILIDGYEDDVRPPTPAELDAVAGIPAEDAPLRTSLGLERLLGGLSGVDSNRRHLLAPTCTICGIVGGYTGEGGKTVSPCLAAAKLDFRLVPNQRPEEVVARLRRHLDRHGFGDVAVRAVQGELPARTPLDAPFVGLVCDAAREVYGLEPVVFPTMAATGPMYCFTELLGLPVATAGVGYQDCRMHAPDENIRLDDFRRGIKMIAAILERMGRESSAA